MVDGVSNGTVTSYTFTNVVSSHKISAIFESGGYLWINSSAGPNGSILPNGNITTIPFGSDQVYTITPVNSSYVVADVKVDGVSKGAVTSYTFYSVTDNHTIVATFKLAPPVASFTTNPSPATGTVPLTVTFTNTSTGVLPMIYDWDFGDGTPHDFTSTPPAHNYTVNGTYTAKLTVTNAGGTSFATVPITVNQIGVPVASFTGIPLSGTVPLTVTFTDTSSGTPTSWNWIFGDGSPENETVKNPVHTYTAIGSYNVTLTATNGGGSSIPITKTYYINVTAAPVSYTITASAGAGGTISPSGSVSVLQGASQTFTITRNTSYHIADVLVNGSSVGAVSTYTFPNVQASHTIAASFAQNQRGQIYYEGFESGSTGWVLTGASRQDGAVPKNQTWSMRLQNNDNMYRPTSTAGYSSIIVQFAWALTSNAAGENAYAEYSTNGGTSWNALSQINGPVTQSTLTIVNSSPLSSSADNNANFQLRFRITGSNTQDKLYVDDVLITGIPD
jgi:PKD repeat protein